MTSKTLTDFHKYAVAFNIDFKKSIVKLTGGRQPGIPPALIMRTADTQWRWIRRDYIDGDDCHYSFGRAISIKKATMYSMLGAANIETIIIVSIFGDEGIFTVLDLDFKEMITNKPNKNIYLPKIDISQSDIDAHEELIRFDYFSETYLTENDNE